MDHSKSFWLVMGLVITVYFMSIVGGIWFFIEKFLPIQHVNNVSTSLKLDSEQPYLYLCMTRFDVDYKSYSLATVDLKDIPCRKGSTMFQIPVFKTYIK